MGIFDAIWRKRGRPSQIEIEGKEPTYNITQTDRDYSDLLERGDVAIKFWLPELMDNILSESCRFFSTTRSDLVRQTLFSYLYGRYDLIGFAERKDCSYQLNNQIMFSRSNPVEPADVPAPDLMRDLGKTTEDLKVWIPVKMKDDIQDLADKTSITLSEMIREIIISSLFGHTYLPARKELMQMKIDVEIPSE